MFKFLLFALVALCGVLCHATDIGINGAGDDAITQDMMEDALNEAVSEDMSVAGRDLLGSRSRKFIHNFFSHKFKSPKKPKHKRKTHKKGPKKTKRTSSHKSYSSSKKTIVSKASCKAVATAKTKSINKKKVIKAFAKAIAVGCGKRGHVTIKRMSNILKKATLAIAKATTTAKADCYSKGNAFGCAAAKSQAVAYAKGLATIITDAYALAKNKCNYCTGVKAEAFTGSIDVLKVFIWAESKASAYVCVKGNAKASAYQKCYAKTIAVGFARAIAKAFLKAYGSCYKNSKSKAAVETEVEAGYIEKFFGECKGRTKKTKYF